MDKSEKLFSKIRSDLARKLENTWETSDQEVLNIIDELLLEERKKFYLSLKRMEELRKELFRSLRKWTCWKSCWKMIRSLKSW